jgi:deoxyribodipyrimidine photo-lyase
MKEAIVPAPETVNMPKGVRGGRRRRAKEMGLSPSPKSGLQPGGESIALDTLDTFLARRSLNYRTDMSSPVTAWDGCSRLSPYLAQGAISMKVVHQRLEARRNELRVLKPSDPKALEPGWLGSLSSFAGRLRWHCHFMQKLEDEPRIEFENMARCYDGVREDDWNPARFDAWCAGMTGYPMVDACMRALHEKSWINFRMRAMLMSFAAYDLWLHWREPAVYLAKHFLDFEAGIHFSQAQMQSGTTGINTMRIYSPAKQVRDHDPTGEFIRRWVPELEGVPDKYIAEPHTMSGTVQEKAGCIIGKHYPPPIVDHREASAEARKRMGSVRRTEKAREEARDILDKHGSRKRPGTARGGRKPKK